MAKSKRVELSKKHVTLIAAIILLFLFVCSIALRGVSSIEQRVFWAVHHLPNALSWPFWLITQAGSWPAVVLLVGVALAFRKKRLALFVTLSNILAYVLSYMYKELAARPRPAAILPDVHTRIDHVGGFGFPSAHSAIAAALATSLWFYAPKKYRWLLIVWVVLVGISRIYLGVHFPLDVIGGVCVGIIAAQVVWIFIRPRK